MKHPRRPPAIVDDLEGGEFCRVDAGLVRITRRTALGERQAILLRDDLTELGVHIWLKGNTRVLELLVPPAMPCVADGGGEVDPLTMQYSGPGAGRRTR